MKYQKWMGRWALRLIGWALLAIASGLMAPAEFGLLRILAILTAASLSGVILGWSV